MTALIGVVPIVCVAYLLVRAQERRLDAARKPAGADYVAAFIASRSGT